MRIAQLANFWTPTSGGLRVVMERLAEGYAARGDRVLQVVPGAEDGQVLTPWGRRTVVAAPAIPGAGGYRLVLRRRHVERLLDAWQPDAVEVSDRATMVTAATRWAARQARPVRVVLVAHERLDRILAAGPMSGAAGALPVAGVADRWNPRCHRGVDEIVTPSVDAAAEWLRVGIVPRVVPWGVDLATFRPDVAGRRAPVADEGLRLAWVGRLSDEKRPDLAVDALRELRRLDVDASLTMVGDGPRRAELEVAAGGLPVEWAGHVADPARVAAVLASSSVALSTSGIETFGLAVLEAMACGVPVVACRGGAAADVAGPGGRAVDASGPAIAAGALSLWRRPELRAVAAARASEFTWDRTVARMVELHGGVAVAA